MGISERRTEKLELDFSDKRRPVESFKTPSIISPLSKVGGGCCDGRSRQINSCCAAGLASHQNKSDWWTDMLKHEWMTEVIDLHIWMQNNIPPFWLVGSSRTQLTLMTQTRILLKYRLCTIHLVAIRERTLNKRRKVAKFLSPSSKGGLPWNDCTCPQHHTPNQSLH